MPDIRVIAWASDFARAVHGRPLWAKLLLRLALGRFAARELYGLWARLKESGFDPAYDYTLQGMQYHRDRIPALHRW